jgi:hypothetical protein
MAKKPKISAEVEDTEMESFRAAASAKGVTLSEWIRMKLSSPDGPEVPPPPPPPAEPPPPPPETPKPLLESAPPAAFLKNPLPAQLAASVSVAQKRAMLFESPDLLPAYQAPPRGEGPQSKPLVASHPVVTAPPPAVLREGQPDVRNARTEEAVRVAEHPCVHLRVGAPGNLRPGECFGTCGNQRQAGKPCFWGPPNARSCGLFNARVAQIISAGQKTPVFPRH